MINFRWGFLAGMAALVLSIVLGVSSGVNILHIILRALIFTVVFFGFGTGIWILINNFLPELLSSDDVPEESDVPERPGSRVNITLDNNKGFAVPEMYRNSGDPEEVGNIGDLLSGTFRSSSAASAKPEPSASGMDLNGEDSYTYEGRGGLGSLTQDSSGLQDAAPLSIANFDMSSFTAPVFTPSFGDDSAGLGGLPDLDAMAGSFLSGSEGNPDLASSLESAGPVRDSMGNKPQPLKGDFNPKELAQGIRTVLNKEK